MSFLPVALTTMLIAIVIVLGVVMVKYVSSLVANAYQIKIELQADLESGLRRIEEDLDKRARLVKRELLDELMKLRTASDAETNRRITEVVDALQKAIRDLDEATVERSKSIIRTLDDVRRDLDCMHVDFRVFKREKRGEKAAPTLPGPDGEM
ncbi:MAG: hypothetical protein H7840_00810 [Alphaproteobacteria bacterium]